MGKTWYVDGVGGSDANGGTGWGDAFATIAKAIANANDGDTILVADTVYAEHNLNFGGKNLILRGVDRYGTGKPVIDCQQQGRAFEFVSGETADAVLEGFVFRNGSVSDRGGAILCGNCSGPTIRDCVFDGNHAGDEGGALFCNSSSNPIVCNCVFTGNSAGYDGGAVNCHRSRITVINCTFYGNQAGDDGGAFEASLSYVVVRNSILWGNTASSTGNEIYVWDEAVCLLENCCVESGGYGGFPANIKEINCLHQDPQFVSPSSGDLHLQASSPCIDAGDNAFLPEGVDSDVSGSARIADGDGNGTATVDIGAYEAAGSSTLSLWITVPSLPGAVEGKPYSVTLKATGGRTPYNWTWSNLPSWLSAAVSGNSLLLSGTPPAGTAGTTYTGITVTVSDGTQSDARDYSLTVGGKVWYVNVSGGSDSNGGTGWSDAFATISKALSVAADGDTVMVADGTYRGSSNKGLILWGRRVRLEGVDHNTPGQKPEIDCEGSGRAFIFCCGEGSDTEVVNFTIRNGHRDEGGAVLCVGSSPTIKRCSFTSNEADYGGALYCCSGASPAIAECAFSGNKAKNGGAICCRFYCRLTVTDTAFSNNESTFDGAVIHCSNEAPLALDNCSFSGNTSRDDGGVIVCKSGSDLTAKDCVFSGNNAEDNGGVIDSLDADLTLQNCQFLNNTAVDRAGAINCGGDGALTLSGCVFSHNRADDAGAVRFSATGAMSATGCNFHDNNANYDAGALSLRSSSATLIACVFRNNTAGDDAGAVEASAQTQTFVNCLFYSNTAGEDGGAVFFSSTTAVLTNCSFCANDATENGGAIYCYNSTLTFNNCILWGDSATLAGAEVYVGDAASSCTLNYCCTDNAGYGFKSGVPASTIDDSNNCIHQDPLYVGGGDLHLQSGSPCVDAGDNSYVPQGVATDLDGDPRVVDGDNDGTATVDVGCYEKQ